MSSSLSEQMAQAALLSATSNLIAQGAAAYQSDQPLIKYVAYGILNTPVNVVWQQFLENRFPGKPRVVKEAETPSAGTKNVLIKFALDQSVGAVFNIVLFIVASSAMNGSGTANIMKAVRQVRHLLLRGSLCLIVRRTPSKYTSADLSYGRSCRLPVLSSCLSTDECSLGVWRAYYGACTSAWYPCAVEARPNATEAGSNALFSHFKKDIASSQLGLMDGLLGFALTILINQNLFAGAQALLQSHANGHGADGGLELQSARQTLFLLEHPLSPLVGLGDECSHKAAEAAVVIGQSLPADAGGLMHLTTGGRRRVNSPSACPWSQ